MLISFFEEFPSDESFEKLKLIDFPTKLYIAAISIKEFTEIKNKIKNKNVKQVIYWPILPIREGYYFSPWVRTSILERFFKNINNEPIMLDFELPRNRKLILTQSFSFFKNRYLIRKFIKEYKNEKYSAEYLPEKGFISNQMKFFGLSYSPIVYGNKIIKMFYRSLHYINNERFKEELHYGRILYKDNFLVGLGCIDTGINKTEKILKPKQLEEDLKICKNLKVTEVVIYRLNGLNQDYLRKIKNINQ